MKMVRQIFTPAVVGLLFAVGLPGSGALAQSTGADAGPPPEMARFAFLEGRWRYQSSFMNYQSATAPWVETPPRETHFEPRYDGGFYIGSLDTNFPEGSLPWGDTWSTFVIFSYDRFQNEYRIGFFDHAWALFDVYEGVFDEQGRLLASNEESGTWGPNGANGELGSGAFRIVPGDRDSFALEWLSRTGFPDWTPVMRTTFTRIE